MGGGGRRRGEGGRDPCRVDGDEEARRGIAADWDENRQLRVGGFEAAGGACRIRFFRRTRELWCTALRMSMCSEAQSLDWVYSARAQSLQSRDPVQCKRRSSRLLASKIFTRLHPDVLPPA